MNEAVKDLLKRIEECDSLHNNCDYLLEHDESYCLISYIKDLQQQIEELEGQYAYECGCNAEFVEYQERIKKAIEVIEEEYYSKNTTNINSIVISSNKLIQIRKILLGEASNSK